MFSILRILQEDDNGEGQTDSNCDAETSHSWKAVVNTEGGVKASDNER